MFVEEKYNQDGEEIITTVQVSYCIIAFDVASFFCYFLHGKTISLMGRKNAIIIGLFIQLVTNVAIGMLSNLPQDWPQTFIISNVILRLIQGYGDSLSLTAVFSMAILEVPTPADTARIIATIEIFFGMGEATGPILGSLMYASFGF